MREDLTNMAVLIGLAAVALAVGLGLGWSDGALGVAVLAAMAVGLFAIERLPIRSRDRNRRGHGLDRPRTMRRA